MPRKDFTSTLRLMNGDSTILETYDVVIEPRGSKVYKFTGEEPDLTVSFTAKNSMYYPPDILIRVTRKDKQKFEPLLIMEHDNNKQTYVATEKSNEPETQEFKIIKKDLYPDVQLEAFFTNIDLSVDTEPADKFDLISKVQEIEDLQLDESLYIKSTWDNLQSSLATANDLILDDDLVSSQQWLIDDALADLIISYEDLKLIPEPEKIDYNLTINDVSYLDHATIKVKNDGIEYLITKENDLVVTLLENESKSFEWIVTANEGKVFNETPLYTENDYYPYENDFFTGDRYEQKITFSGSHNLVIDNLDVVDYEPESETYNFTVNILGGFDKATFEVEHLGVKYPINESDNNLDIKVFEGESTDFKYIITAKSGSIFANIPLYTENYNPEVSGYEKSYYKGTNEIQTMKIEGRLTNSIKVDSDAWVFNIKPTIDTENLPYNKIYEVNEEQLNVLSNYSYITREIKSGFTYEIENLDYAEFFTGLFALPYKLDTSSYRDNPILLGDINTGIVTKQIPEYLHDINLGNITIMNDATDKIGFKNIEVKLYVPYFNSVILETDEVLGFEISLQLKLNVITGKGTLNVYSLRTDSIIYTETTQIGVKIPYTVGETLDLSTTNVLETAYKKAYIQLKVLKPDNDVQITGTRLINVDNEYQYLKDDSDINLKSYATEKEQKLIEQHINNGIFVRKN